MHRTLTTPSEAHKLLVGQSGSDRPELQLPAWCGWQGVEIWQL